MEIHVLARFMSILVVPALTLCSASAGCTSIFVGNLPYNVSQQAVADIFRPIGGRRNIVRVSVKQGKGFAHVEFNLTVSTTELEWIAVKRNLSSIARICRIRGVLSVLRVPFFSFRFANGDGDVYFFHSCEPAQSCVDKAFEYLQGVKFMGRRIRLDYANKAKAAGPPSREENLARQQQQALAAKAAAAAGGGASGAGRQISAPANSNSVADSKAASSPAADLDDGDMCPLCCEPLDKTDQSFEPCDCGYQVRTYCHQTPSVANTNTACLCLCLCLCSCSCRLCMPCRFWRPGYARLI